MLGRALLHRLGCGVLASALALVPLPSNAALAPPDGTADAQQLYDQGRQRFEVGDYDGALEHWGNAYGLVSHAEDNDRTRYELLYSIALAHQRAYATDRDTSHLRRARDLLLKCQTAVGQVFEGDASTIESEHKRVRALLDEIVEEMTDPTPAGEQPPAGDAAPAPVVAPAPDPQPAPAPEPQPQTQPQPQPAPAPAIDPTPPNPNAGKGLFGGGLAAMGIGVAGLGIMAAGMAIGRRADDFSGLDPNDLSGRAAQIQRGKRGNTLSVTGAILAIGLPVGFALTLMGRKKMKMAASASAGAGQAGLTLRGRF